MKLVLQDKRNNQTDTKEEFTWEGEEAFEGQINHIKTDRSDHIDNTASQHSFPSSQKQKRAEWLIQTALMHLLEYGAGVETTLTS